MTKVKFSVQLNDEQKKAKELIRRTPYNFIHGLAGTGKTLLACQIGLDLVLNKRGYDKIVMTRPTVSMEDNGFIPGGMKEKLEPWLIPLIDNLKKVYPQGNVIDKMIENDKIDIVALSHFRGRTYDRSVCIVDEYQNLTKRQLALVAGRLGKDSIMIFTGDPYQIDFRDKYLSASEVTPHLSKLDFVNVIELMENHRHPTVTEMLKTIHNFI